MATSGISPAAHANHAGTVDSAISAREHHAVGGDVLRFRRIVHRHGGARADG